MAILLLPIQGYVFFLLFNHPAGWLLLNILIPLKAHYEYTQIHENILYYVLNQNEKRDNKSHMFLEKLVKSINNGYITLGMQILIHLSIMTLSTATIGFFLVSLYVIIFIIKLTRFHNFMTHEHPNEKVFADAEFSLEALVLSCLSLFLEVFGHIFISLISGLGYGIYIMQKNYILIIVGLGWVSNFVRSQRFGSHPFAQYVAPSLRLEGVLLSIFTSTFVSYAFYEISKRTEGEFMIAKIQVEEYLMFGLISSFLGVIGDLLTQFLRRCGNTYENHDVELSGPLSQSVLVQMWYKTKVLNHLSGFLLPTIFIFWYASTFLPDTFYENPFEVSMFSLIKNNS